MKSMKSNKLIIVVSCLMGSGTLEAKLVPLAMVDKVCEIHVLRKERASILNKVHYHVLPQLCRFRILNLLVTPMLLSLLVLRKKANLIIGYHVIPHGFFAFIASIITRRPYIIGQTGLTIQNRAMNGSKYAAMIRFVIDKSYKYLVPGSSSKKFWESLGFDHRKIENLHSTIDTSRFSPAQIDCKTDFVYVGRLSKEKRVDLILKAFGLVVKEIPSATMTIVGDGPEREILKNLCRTMDLENSVVWTGFVENVQDALNGSKVFVLFSETEGLPTALMQAMACGLLCISNDVGNISDVLVNGETGFIVDSNVISLSKEMINVVSKYSYFDDMKHKSRELIVQKHSYGYACQRWTELLDNYIERGDND